MDMVSDFSMGFSVKSGDISATTCNAMGQMNYGIIVKTLLYECLKVI